MTVGSVSYGLNSSAYRVSSWITNASIACPSSSLLRSRGSLQPPLRRGVNILRNMPLVLSHHILSHAASPITHTGTHLHSSAPAGSVSAKPPNPATPVLREAPSFDIVDEERLLQDLVEEVLTQGVWTTRTRRLRRQELVEARPSTRLAVMAALSRMECERAPGVIKAAVAKVRAKRKRFVLPQVQVERFGISITVMHAPLTSRPTELF
ncbi:hypothetical protein H4582DRAFT_2100036 [Lactarius indigo]|nr:hypothetical protein H4582DRAFT_2100036 [Lactarius indigo]